MNPRMIISMAVATMSLVFAAGCSSDAKKKSEDKPKTTQTKNEVAGQQYTSLAFDPGETRLSDMDRQNLQNLASQARQSGREIDDIKIITWADKEYKDGKDASSNDVILARQRAEAIKTYLQGNLGDEDVDYHNMAQKPASLAKFFKTKEGDVEKLFKRNNDLNMTTGSKASKGLVIIEYENESGTNI